ncbi:ACYPI54654 protein, partial [Aphis craccivora]
PHSSYTCSENNCTQSFQTLSSFKKHFIKKHSIENHLDKSETNNEILINNDIVNFCDVQMISNEVNNDETFKDFQNLPEIPLIKVEIDINKSIEQLHMSAVGFALSLHNNNNFCRSDVLNIIDDIEDKIIKPITSLLEGVTKSEISDPLILSKFSKITSAIS